VERLAKMSELDFGGLREHSLISIQHRRGDEMEGKANAKM
jgi:hypothetical protein